MKITLLGTGDAVGTPKIGCECPSCLDALNAGRSRRLRFTIMVENEGGRVLVDTSPDLRWQMIRARVSEVDAVIWTHSHYDHYAGFADFHRIQNNVPVYGKIEIIDCILRYLYFMDPIRCDVEPYEPFELIGLKWTLFNVDHPPLEHNTGILVENSDGKRVAITSDTTMNLPQKSLDLIRDTDLLIADAIMPPEIQVRKHMNCVEAMQLAKDVNARQVVLTHISHNFPPHEVAASEWPLGYDGMTIDL